MDKKVEQEIKKPLCLEMRDTKQLLISVINDAIQRKGLPAYILRGIVEEILGQVKEAENAEIAAAENAYNNSMAQAKESEIKD